MKGILLIYNYVWFLYTTVNKLGVLTINSQPHANCVPRNKQNHLLV